MLCVTVVGAASGACSTILTIAAASNELALLDFAPVLPASQQSYLNSFTSGWFRYSLIGLPVPSTVKGTEVLSKGLSAGSYRP